MHDDKDAKKPSWKRLGALMPTSATVADLLTTSNRVAEERAAEERYALMRTTLMYGFFRKADVEEAGIFFPGIALTLANYPREVIDYVTDLSTGLASRQNFPPSQAEVRQACEERARWLERQRERAAGERRQLEERRAWEEGQQDRPTREEIEDELRRRLAYRGSGGKHMERVLAEIAARKAERAASICDPEHRISDEQWAAIPNALAGADA